jgi:radical SAM superfamily enzyme YgiQ (UPF0313 family)
MRKYLINPPSPFLVDEKVFPNLGLISLATSQDMDIIDFSGDKNFKNTAKNIRGDWFGFYSTTPQFPMTYKIFKEIKHNNPEAKFVIGGPHASAVYNLDKEDINKKRIEEFDNIFVGEAEKEIELNGKYTYSKLIKNIDEIKIPDRRKVKIDEYSYKILGKKATTVMTQRGCPFQCVFCSGREVEMYKKVRQHSANRILTEMDYLSSELGYEAFMWYDDEINTNPKRLEEIAGLLKKRDYIHRGFVRSDLVVRNPKSIDHLADMGFVELCFGVESGSNRILKNINKGTNYEMNLKAVKLIKDRGIKTKIFTIVGLPDETYEDIMLTKQWIEEAQPDSFDICILNPYPGSKIYNLAKPSNELKGYNFEYNGVYFNKIDFANEDSFYKGKAGEYSCFVRTKTLTSENLINLRDKVEKDLR